MLRLLLMGSVGRGAGTRGMEGHWECEGRGCLRMSMHPLAGWLAVGVGVGGAGSTWAAGFLGGRSARTKSERLWIRSP